MMRAIDTWANLNRWHRRPVENACLAGGWLLLAVALPPFPGAVVVGAAAALAAIFGAGIPARVFARVLAAPLLFLVPGFLVMAVTLDFSGGALLQFNRGGLEQAAAASLRAMGAMACLALLCLTTPLASLLGILRRLRLPDALTELMGLIYRMLFLLDERRRVMLLAQTGRLGYGNWRTGWRSAAMLAARLFQNTIIRARAMEQGLNARNYDGQPRVPENVRRPAPGRLALCALLLLLSTLPSLAWWRLHHGN